MWFVIENNVSKKRCVVSDNELVTIPLMFDEQILGRFEGKKKAEEFSATYEVPVVKASEPDIVDEVKAEESDFPYKYSEGKLLDELREYFQSTYGEHYSSEKNKVQTLEFIMEQFERGEDFLKGCALKYLCRYGKKAGKNRKDLLKAIHYLIFMLHYADNKKES